MRTPTCTMTVNRDGVYRLLALWRCRLAQPSSATATVPGTWSAQSEGFAAESYGEMGAVRATAQTSALFYNGTPPLGTRGGVVGYATGPVILVALGADEVVCYYGHGNTGFIAPQAAPGVLAADDVMDEYGPPPAPTVWERRVVCRLFWGLSCHGYDSGGGDDTVQPVFVLRGCQGVRCRVRRGVPRLARRDRSGSDRGARLGDDHEECTASGGRTR